jgi:AcrR family transcriptional regulator
VGRKSLKSLRTEQILDAFEHCICAEGFQSTTLESIAHKAGMDRRMVHHYIGNKNDVVDKGVVRIIKKFYDFFDLFICNVSDNGRLENGVGFLFSEQFNKHPSTQCIAALLPITFFDPQVKSAIKSVYDAFMSFIVNEIKIFNPTADPIHSNEVAYTIVCLSFGSGWMTNIGLQQSSDKNKSIALALIYQLGHPET